MQVTAESRTAIDRARFFHSLAAACPADDRVEYEAYLEASIVFGRAALHRLRTKYKGRPAWNSWWGGLLTTTSVKFFRDHRNFLLKEAPPKIGQRLFVRSPGGEGLDYMPTRAEEFYVFEAEVISATATVGRHLREIERLIEEAERRFA